jgi:hypothetical protein
MMDEKGLNANNFTKALNIFYIGKMAGIDNIMNDSQFFSELSGLILKKDEELHFIEEKIINIKMCSELIEPIFKLFENNPDFDFGIPGNLVRYIENFPEEIYIPELYKSLERKPTEYNLWMLNRHLNTLTENKKDNGIKILETIIELNNCSDIKKLATRFLNRHKNI